MIYAVAIALVLVLMYGSAALGYYWATHQHRDWMEDGWDHLTRVAEYRALTVKDYHDTFGEIKDSAYDHAEEHAKGHHNE